MPTPSPLPVLTVYAGFAALFVLWLRLGRRLSQKPGTPVSRVLAVIGAWSLPFVVGPPLFSNDVYNYAAQGELVSRHISPYLYGPGVLGDTPFTMLAGSFWANSPSPYGPVFLKMAGLLASLSDHRVLVEVLALRLIALAGLALAAWGIASLAGHYRRDPAWAVLFGLGSPLVLATLVAGAHNDALMLGLLVAGVALWQRRHPLPAIVVCALAAGIKAPALLGVVVIGWNWVPPGAGVLARAGRCALAAAIAAITLEAVALASGLGWGWLASTAPSSRANTPFTPVDSTVHWLTALLPGGALNPDASLLRTAVVAAAYGLALLVSLWLLWHSPRLGPVKALGFMLLATTALNPVIWPWYVTWAIAALTPVVSKGWRRALTALVALETLATVGSLSLLFSSLQRGAWLLDVAFLGLLGLLAALGIGPLGRASAPALEGNGPPAPAGRSRGVGGPLTEPI